MSRLLLLAATVLGLNAANVPANLGDALSTVGNAGSGMVSAASNVVGTNGGGLNIGKVSQASMLGGLTGGSKPIFVKKGSLTSLTGGSPINVAKPRVAKRSGNFLGI